mmetsp:Transcript_50091/g.98028  ORF Transcript_50091/g.98028 Transcript_50091/m.98028 type:complete len:312 (-) Transcript_50091:455-1390(-)
MGASVPGGDGDGALPRPLRHVRPPRRRIVAGERSGRLDLLSVSHPAEAVSFVFQNEVAGVEQMGSHARNLLPARQRGRLPEVRHQRRLQPAGEPSEGGPGTQEQGVLLPQRQPVSVFQEFRAGDRQYAPTETDGERVHQLPRPPHGRPGPPAAQLAQPVRGAGHGRFRMGPVQLLVQPAHRCRLRAFQPLDRGGDAPPVAGGFPPQDPGESRGGLHAPLRLRAGLLHADGRRHRPAPHRPVGGDAEARHRTGVGDRAAGGARADRRGAAPAPRSQNSSDYGRQLQQQQGRRRGDVGGGGGRGAGRGRPLRN